MSSRRPPSAPRSSSPPAWPRSDERAAPRIAPMIVCETPSISFSATLPVKPSVTTTSALPATTSPPSTLPTNSSMPPPVSRARSASAAWVSSTSALPRPDSSPLESSPTRGRCTPSTDLARAAPM